MPLYTPESLLRLRERVNLVEVLLRHMELKRAGASFKGLCPFHEEKSPSFIVKPGDRFYHCFGCGAHGDAIAFLMGHLHLSFVEAVELLAEQFQIHLEKQQEIASTVDYTQLKAALALSHAFFQHTLLKTQEGKEALLYLNNRQLGLAFVERFGLGLAPASAQSFLQTMKERGFTHDILIEAGLLTREGKPFFRERIIFPIHNAMGSVVGFSARKFKEDTFGGKYINSPDTPLFKKSKILFGYNFSRRRMAKERKAIIVEGQIDCLRLIEARLDITVAALGTAFTQEHVQMLKTLGVISAVALFDGDKAGRQAASKVGHLFHKQGIDMRVALLPEGMDPDDFIRKEGREALLTLLGRPQDYLSFELQQFSEQYDMSMPASKTEVIRRLATQIHEWQDPVMIHESLKKLAKLTQVPEHFMVEVPKPEPWVNKTKVQGAIKGERSLESDLLRWLTLGEDESLVELILKNVTPDDFVDEECRALFEAFIRAHRRAERVDLIALVAELGCKEGMLEGSHLMEELMAKKINQKGGLELCQKTIQQMLDRNWLKKRAKIQQKISQPEVSEEQMQELVKAFDRLKNERPQIRL